MTGHPDRHRTSGHHRTSDNCRVNSVDCSVLGCVFRTSVRDRTSGESDIRCRTDNRLLVYAIWRVPFGTPMGTGHPMRRTSGVDRTSGIFASPLMFSRNTGGHRTSGPPDIRYFCESSDVFPEYRWAPDIRSTGHLEGTGHPAEHQTCCFINIHKCM